MQPKAQLKRFENDVGNGDKKKLKNIYRDGNDSIDGTSETITEYSKASESKVDRICFL